MDLTTLAGDVMVEAPNCPTFLAEAKLREAAAEFCRRTRQWRGPLDAIITIANLAENEYDLAPPSGARVVSLLRCTVDGQNAGLYEEVGLDARNPTWRESTGPTVQGVVALSTLKVAMYPKVTAGGQTIVVTAALTPTDDTVSDEIGDRYRDAFIYGALYRLLNMRVQPWYDPGEAEKKRRFFEREISDAKNEVGFTDNDLSVKMRRVW